MVGEMDMVEGVELAVMAAVFSDDDKKASGAESSSESEPGKRAKPARGRGKG